MPTEPSEARIAVFLDYENLAIGARESLGATFDFAPVADALAERGRVIARRAYADWSYFDSDRRMLTRHQVELIDIPQKMGGSRKNAADIKLAIDAIELALERDFVSTFVICTGDSDLSPLVQKLRELDRTVIGVGIRSSTSKLLPPACDEFLFYERLVDLDAKPEESEPRNGEPKRKERTVAELEKLVMGTLSGLHTSGDTAVLASQLKRTLLRKDSTFSEGEYGFRSFGELIHHLEGKGILTTSPGPAAGDPEIAVAEGGGEQAAFDLLVRIVTAESKRGRVQLSGLKNKLRNEAEDFSEKTYGFSGFLQFVKAAQTRGLVTLT